jgi:alanyl-tRNA synthetase
MFTIAGMVQFKPYFVGEQTPPAPRATTVQPCFRMVDIDNVGTTARHATFFEMLGNFSFGDYFKQEAIPFAWEFVTEVLGLDPDRLWVTVHESDTDASGIWQEAAGVAAERIQEMGADNFWQMGDTGPCGPCSEIYYDKGPAYGPEGGPAHGGDERFVEIWNLVFMQFERALDGSLSDLPRKNIDTGAGLERILAILQGVDSLFDTDGVVPIVEAAQRLTGHRLGETSRGDVALRILADHARAMTFLISDGVFPTNEGRGYVLRRVIRRAVMRAHQLGTEALVTPALTAAVIEQMKAAYPRLERDAGLVETVVSHEEEAFRRTLRAGTALIEEELAKGGDVIAGDVAFKLHDTYGFPIDLTVEVANERNVRVDRAGFDVAMDDQRARARLAGKAGGADRVGVERWRAVLEEFGPTEFVGYRETEAKARVLAVEARHDGETIASLEGEQVPAGFAALDVVLDVTPFYAEGGGQVGDTGVIEGPAGRFRVLDTTVATEGVTRHTGYVLEGSVEPGAEVTAAIDTDRRNAIRRNHTATHLLQFALRRVLGDHVQQQGSRVEPDRLRFDFSHFAALSDAERREVEEIVNREVLTDSPVRIYETTKSAAEESGAIAFFGDKYGSVVRVVEAGTVSVELCGGTHVSALGMIGPFKILSEGSIGANTRRIEATTGRASFAQIRTTEELVERAADLVRVTPAELPDALARLLDRQRSLEEELRGVRAAALHDEARRLAAAAAQGTVCLRRDGLDANELRELALSIRHDGVDAVGLVGTPDGVKVALVVAVSPAAGLDARAIASEAASLIGGGGGGSPEVATAGGRDPSGIDACLARLSSAFGLH